MGQIYFGQIIKEKSYTLKVGKLNVEIPRRQEKFINILKQNENIESNKFAWFEYTEAKRGNKIDNIWLSSKDLPLEILEKYLDYALVSKDFIFDNNFIESVIDISSSADNLLNKTPLKIKFQNILYLKLIRKNHKRISPHLTADFKNYFDSITGQNKKPKKNLNKKPVQILNKEPLKIKDGRIPEYKKVTKFKPKRRKKESNKLSVKITDLAKDLQNSVESLTVEKKELDKKLQKLVKKYSRSPEGIRNEEQLRNICINCSSDSVVEIELINGFNRSCKVCETSWYINHCWNCESGRVDSRDPKNPRCKVCGWLKCTCQACHYQGCKTNEYSKDHKLSDQDDLPSLNESEKFQECMHGTDRKYCAYCTEDD